MTALSIARREPKPQALLSENFSFVQGDFEIAIVSGSTNRSSRISTITSTARLRRRQSRASNHSSAGHVATTTMAAQIVAPRNGRRTQSEDPMSRAMLNTLSVILAKSVRFSVMVRCILA